MSTTSVGVAYFTVFSFMIPIRLTSMTMQMIAFAMAMFVLPTYKFIGTKSPQMIAKITHTMRQDVMFVSSSLLKSIFQLFMA